MSQCNNTVSNSREVYIVGKGDTIYYLCNKHRQRNDISLNTGEGLRRTEKCQGNIRYFDSYG